MALCDRDGCVNTATAALRSEDGSAQNLCEACVLELYGLRRCANPACSQPATLTVTIAWESYGVVQHHFCSQECADLLLASLGRPDVDGAIRQILGGNQ